MLVGLLAGSRQGRLDAQLHMEDIVPPIRADIKSNFAARRSRFAHMPHCFLPRSLPRFCGVFDSCPLRAFRGWAGPPVRKRFAHALNGRGFYTSLKHQRRFYCNRARFNDPARIFLTASRDLRWTSLHATAQHLSRSRGFTNQRLRVGLVERSTWIGAFTLEPWQAL